MHDKFRKRYQMERNSQTRVRRQIAVEAARRMWDDRSVAGDESGLSEASESDLYAAKRKAAAVLGHRVRPGDLPSDSEVRQEFVSLAKTKSVSGDVSNEVDRGSCEGDVMRMADHLDRFTIYKLLLEPLESIKQNPKHHPEGDVLYHSLQVFERAKAARPHDEEFLTAALLHEVGKAIDPPNYSSAARRPCAASLPSGPSGSSGGTASRGLI